MSATEAFAHGFKSVLFEMMRRDAGCAPRTKEKCFLALHVSI